MLHTYLHTYVHTYTHTYLHTYIHTYIHMYITTCTYCRKHSIFHFKPESLAKQMTLLDADCFYKLDVSQ